MFLLIPILDAKTLMVFMRIFFKNRKNINVILKTSGYLTINMKRREIMDGFTAKTMNGIYSNFRTLLLFTKTMNVY